ncbi:MAG: hypothetical protein HY287_00035 [Planctomycetes bacterium]|nr:hypothetical protein [Planctomycetota bacterium]
MAKIKKGFLRLTSNRYIRHAAWTVPAILLAFVLAVRWIPSRLFGEHKFVVFGDEVVAPIWLTILAVIVAYKAYRSKLREKSFKNVLRSLMLSLCSVATAECLYLGIWAEFSNRTAYGWEHDYSALPANFTTELRAFRRNIVPILSIDLLFCGSYDLARKYEFGVQWWDFDASIFYICPLVTNPMPPEGSAILVVLFAAPFWLPAILFAIYPILSITRGPLRRARRRRRGQCMKCAYDLTGNISGTCPECGTKIEVRIPRIENKTSCIVLSYSLSDVSID